jgi:cobalamin biosynthesis Co2+ chelatase CbiK
MVDMDGRYSYSNVVSINASCKEKQVQVYPTVTDNKVQVILPLGYERATIQVYNTLGQRINPVISGSGTIRTVELHGFPDTSYLLQVINGNEIKTFKIIKM